MARSGKKSPISNLTKLLKSLPTKAYLDKRLRNFATKDDLRNFATKDDLRNFATKQDIEKLPTKAYLDNRILEVRKEIWKVENRVGKVEERQKLMPTKSDLYDALDKFAQETEKARENNIISTDLTRRVNDHDNRIETVEEKLGIRLAA